MCEIRSVAHGCGFSTPEIYRIRLSATSTYSRRKKRSYIFTARFAQAQRTQRQTIFQLLLPIHYKGIKLNCGYRLDIVVENIIILELKSCEKIEPIHKAQLLTYLRLTGINLGLILNFNVAVLRDGITRIVNSFEE